MGFEFNIEHASLVGWLTRRDFPAPLPGRDGFPDPWDLFWRRHRRGRLHHMHPDPSRSHWRAPRATEATMRSFLEALPQAVVSYRQPDAEALRLLVRQCAERFRDVLVDGPSEPEPLTSTDVARVLAPLRQWFDVPFYFLPLGANLSLDDVRRSPDFTLWLLCSDNRRWRANMDLLDPFPGIRAVLAGTDPNSDGPGATLCWNWAGETIVVSHRRTPIEDLLHLVKDVPADLLWHKIAGFADGPGSGFNILQLSDLHLGSKAVTARQVSYVEQHLRSRIDEATRSGGVVQPVITGDLMDSPSRKSLAEFEAFRARLEDAAKTKAICVPGNHDSRRKGFLWRNWAQLADLEWQSVIASSVCKTVFVCFDTSKNAKLAQGNITKDQFMEVATRIDGLKRIGDYDDHIFVTLVHHHPFSTQDDEVDTLPFLRIREERFVRMENGEDLVRWCASRGVPLILHGHKHRPRFVGREVEFEGRTRLVRAIGCGSSFGVEGKPLSYNWITWQPEARSWTVSYMADPGDGSGFAEKRLIVGANPGGHS